MLKLAWRNLWRNKRRTLITLASIIFNTAILILSYGLVDGLISRAVENATDLVVGEAQIHAPGYLTNQDLHKTIANAESILKKARDEGIGATQRAYGIGLLAHGSKSAGAQFWGLDPTLESLTFSLSKHLEFGKFLEPSATKGIVLGKKLAHALNVQIGDELVVLVQAADGSMGNEIYRVCGILKSAGESLDRNAALIHRDDYNEIFVAQGLTHEIALNSRGKIPLEQQQAIFGSFIQMEFKTWHELLPVLYDMTQVSKVAIWIFGSIFFFVGALGVMNTMLMATFERFREFGLQKALGASPWRILSSVAAEALLLAVIATGLGTVLGIYLCLHFEKHGIDTARWAGQTTIAGIAFDPIWRAALSIQGTLLSVVIMILVCFLASLYPAILAARTNPVEAMHHH